MNFADRLHTSIAKRKSFIVAGFDPRLDTMPKFILDQAAGSTSSNEDAIYQALIDFHSLALEAVSSKIAAVKPNIAFFEQLGLGGLRAFFSITDMIRERELPLVIDAKRGDIGSTAKAYSKALLGKSEAFGQTIPTWNADALTVSPFLGFDTVEAFFEDCLEHEKGLFVLVKTSNPGSGALQGITSPDGLNVSETIAHWLHDTASKFEGSCGFSGLGAVVGATYPEEAKQMRDIMKTNLFLIPGLGSQGGTADDAVASFTTVKGNLGGGIINVSRGLLSSFSSLDIDRETAIAELNQKIDGFNAAVSKSLGS